MAMAHFARIENGIVIHVIVVSACDIGGCDPEDIRDPDRDHTGHDPAFGFPDSEKAGQEYLASLGIDGEWVQTSYSGKIRGQYAGIGMTYDKKAGGKFKPAPQPKAIGVPNA